MSDLWHVEFSTWTSLVGWAKHVMIEIRGAEQRWRVDWAIDAETSAEWEEKDPSFPWPTGHWASRFNSMDDARGAAIAAFAAISQPGDLLVRGSPAAGGPKRPLAGPPELVDRAQGYFDAAEAVGWWEKGMNGAMDEVCRLWDEWTEEVGLEDRDAWGEPEQVAVVERDGDGWRVVCAPITPEAQEAQDDLFDRAWDAR